MRILVLGHNGFIGSHLCARLKRDGHQVIEPTRDISPDAFGNADTVINCAGQLTHVDRMTWDNLMYLSAWLQWASNRHRDDMPRFIQLGSSSETGPVEGARTEDTPCNPSNLYEATKLAATNLCLGYAAEYGLDAVVARPFTVYGSNDTPRKMLPTLWRCYTEGKTFTCHPGGHDWIHVDDFVGGLITLLHAPRAATKGQIYHFGRGISVPNESVVSLFKDAVGGDLKVEYRTEKLRPYDVMDWRADNTKTRALGWEPKIGIVEGISRFVEEETLKAEGAPGL